VYDRRSSGSRSYNGAVEPPTLESATNETTYERSFQRASIQIVDAYLQDLVDQ
jgi:hypothetical protein